jgi:uncharacterized protein YndB with AHSA1/START domain
MEQKTNIKAEDGGHDLTITREFDLPAALVFKAYAEPELFEQWMSHEYGRTRMLKFEGRRHGSYHFQTVDAQENVLFEAHGTIHDFVPDQKITRTFEMSNSPFDVQLEFLEFEPLTGNTSRLTIHTVFRSVAQRDQLLKMPFAQGLNMAHNRLQNILNTLN